MRYKSVEFRFAVSRDELEEAYRLVGRIYRDRGYLRPDWTSDLWVTPHCLLPDTIVLLADLEGKLLGTASLFWLGEMGLPLHKLCPELRLKPPAVEIGKLVVDKSLGPGLFESLAEMGIVIGLFGKAYGVGLWLEKERIFPDVDEVTLSIAVLPHHIPFYRKLGFRPASDLRSYGRVFTELDACCLTQDFGNLRRLVSSNRLLAKFFNSSQADPSSRYRLSWDDVLYFAKERTDLWDRMSDREREILLSAYKQTIR